MIRLLLLVFFVVISGTALSTPVAATAKVIMLDKAQVVVSRQHSPPDFEWAESVHLPHAWRNHPEGFYGSVWYRIALPVLPLSGQQWALLLPDINMNAEVWLGKSLRAGSGGSMQSPLARYWHSPLRVPLAASDLHRADFLYIRVVAFANEFGRLGQVLIGPADLISIQYQRLYFNRTTVHIISMVLALVYVVLMLVVWYQRRDSVLFWGAAVCLSWAISSLNLFVLNPPFNEIVWEKLMQVFMGWTAFLFYFFIVRFDNRPPHRQRERLFFAVAVVFSLALLLSPLDYLFTVTRMWHAYALFMGLLATGLIMISWYRQRRQYQWVLLLALAGIVIAGVHDFFIQHLQRDTGKLFWLDYSVIALLLLIGYLMVLRFLAAVSMAEKLNRELEQRVAQAQQRIGRYYDAITRMEKESILLAERERIYRDIYDDMGGKLLSIIYQAQDKEIHDLAKAAMNDLRAVVSKKTAGKDKLPTLGESG